MPSRVILCRSLEYILIVCCLTACVTSSPAVSEPISTSATENSPVPPTTEPRATPTLADTPTNAPTATTAPTSTPTAYAVQTPLIEVGCEEEALREAITTGGMLYLAAGCNYHLTADLPPLTSDVVIVGENTTIDGGGQYRIFYTESANITVDTLTIQNGYSGSYDGGGISTYDGKITVINSTLQGNTTQSAGGGINTVVGDVTIAHSKLIGNAAVPCGGGVTVENGHITVTQSIFVGNSSVGCGAGIMSNSGTVLISSSTFSSNTVTVHGGGALCLASQEAAATITNSTFSGNSSERGGGAVAAANRASVTLIASTIYNNRAGRGGGVWTDGTLILQQSIVAGNHAADRYDITVDGTGVSDFESRGYNLVEKSGGLKLAPTDVVASVSGLGPLAEGVHVPSVDSLVRNAIPVGECATSSDQRGIPRPQGTGCDIGAIEME